MPFDSAGFLATPNQITELLTRAASRLESGWCQGQLYKGQSVCATGAIFVESCPLENTAIARLNQIAKKLGFGNIILMNDTPGMTKERILAVFAQAKEQPL